MSFLSLSRNVGERIFIDVPASDQPQRIEILLNSVKSRNAARISISADPSILIARSELLDISHRKPEEIRS